MSDMFFRWAT